MKRTKDAFDALVEFLACVEESIDPDKMPVSTVFDADGEPTVYIVWDDEAKTIMSQAYAQALKLTDEKAQRIKKPVVN